MECTEGRKKKGDCDRIRRWKEKEMRFKSKPLTDLQLAKKECSFWGLVCGECSAGKTCRYFSSSIEPIRETEVYREKYGRGKVDGRDDKKVDGDNKAKKKGGKKKCG